MKALVFHYSLPRFAFATVIGKLDARAYLRRPGPLFLEDVPDPPLPGPDWALVRTALCGICGSDTKQAFLDGAFDNPLRTLISFPHVLGHEAVGTIERVGPSVTRRQVGERVVLNPWLSCAPRGIAEPCSSCRHGDYSLCQNFAEGGLPPALHIGNCRGVSGGYAPFFAAHQSQLLPIPDGVSFEQAVLCDPFAVSLHAILKSPPPDGGLALVYGCGTLGLLSVAILHDLFPGARVAIVARYAYQADLGRALGAHEAILTRDPAEVVERVGALTGSKVHRGPKGEPWLLGGADVVYDTIGSAECVAVDLRVARPRANVVITGVNKPARFEWTPLYFKEIGILGANAFGLETWDGKRKHGMEHYLDMVNERGLDLSRLVTHRFRLEQYQEALLLAHRKGRHAAVKAVFDFTHEGASLARAWPQP